MSAFFVTMNNEGKKNQIKEKLTWPRTGISPQFKEEQRIDHNTSF